MSGVANDNIFAAPAAGPPRQPRLEPSRRSSVVGQAVVVIDRGHVAVGASDPLLPPGWASVFANATLPALMAELLAENRLSWSATLLPGEWASAARMSPELASPEFAGVSDLWAISPRILDQIPGGGQSAVVVLNGRHFPLCDLTEAMRRHRQNRCDVTLIDLYSERGPSYDEQLELAGDGQVRHIDRLYGSGFTLLADVYWPAILIISRRALLRLADTPLPLSLSRWPALMLRSGLRLHGSNLPGRSFDLSDHTQVQELAAGVLRGRSQWLCRAGGLRERFPQMLMGQRVRIAPSARLIGPVALGDDVEIDDNALILGPVVIGRGSRIGPGTVLRHVLLPPDSVVSASTPREMAHRQRPGRDIRLEGVLGESLRGLRGSSSMVYHRSKRAIDLLGSALFLGVTLLFYPLIALAIRLSSPGPVFYGHVRQGKGGRPFRCWKFRTMVPNADQIQSKLAASNEVDGPQFKITNDPRIFAVGRWLRRFNIDEWPQAFNVLAGQMSLVGPRPSPERENRLCPAWREARLSVLPGITGLWQVLRRREKETDFQEWIYYDVQYVKRQSFWLDLKILAWTVGVVLKGR